VRRRKDLSPLLKQKRGGAPSAIGGPREGTGKGTIIFHPRALVKRKKGRRPISDPTSKKEKTPKGEKGSH